MYKSCKNILIVLLRGKYLSIKKRQDEHYFYLNSHTLITFMQKIECVGFFYIK